MINEIKDNIDNICKKNIETDLVRTRSLGEDYDFKSGEVAFKKVIDFFLNFQGKDFSGFPEKSQKRIKSLTDNIIAKFTEVEKFVPSNHSDYATAQNNLIAGINQAYTEAFDLLAPLLPYIIYLSSNNLNVPTIEALMNLVHEEQDKIKQETSQLKSELESIVESARKAAGTIGVAKFSVIFEKESAEHERVAKTWLNRTFGVLILLVIVGFLFVVLTYCFGQSLTETPALIQLTVAKLLILTVLFYALNLCSKNYKAHKHNSLLNKHRQNALDTFEAFVKSAGDDNQTKNAVLLETTRTIFSNQQTGYLSGENEVEMPSRIIEIIKSNSEK